MQCNSFMLSMLYSNRESSVVGKEVTPFVLQRVNELTKGQSLQASILPLYNSFHLYLNCGCFARKTIRPE